jgi:hypothetical protein
MPNNACQHLVAEHQLGGRPREKHAKAAYEDLRELSREDIESILRDVRESARESKVPAA